MSDQPINITTDILIAIRDDIAAFRSSVDQKFETVEGRLTRVEELLHKHRRDSAGMLVMMRATVTDFDERVSEVEERVAALEAKTS
jgi:phage-related minor tail protein